MSHLLKNFVICAVMVMTVLLQPAHAVQPDEVLKDPALEQRARELSAKMRCLVCQNQSIDDSDAPLARDLRILIRERLTIGDSNDQVVDYLVSRYGEFVLLKPLLSPKTIILWVGPFAILLFGAAMLYVRRRKGNELAVPEEALSPSEENRLKAILNKKD